MAKSNKCMYGSICVSDIIDAINEKHSALYKAKNEKVYANVRLWIKDGPDQYGNEASVQLAPKKDSEDKKTYIGNMKWADVGTPPAPTMDDLPPLGDDSNPFGKHF